MTNSILVTGGAGYIGSHTVVQLLEQDHHVTILDNFSNSSPQVLERIQRITGKQVALIKADIRDRESVRDAFKSRQFDAVIHFAGLKAVGEAEAFPLKYYDNNVTGSQVLLEEMLQAGVNRIVFSSSATVYGAPGQTQYHENLELAPINVYGRTKRIVEDMLRDTNKAQPQLRIALLRYFNPVGAHPSGLIGEDPNGIPNNLMPFIAQVAVGKREKLSIFGNDYPTPDGTGMRDFIHVQDLASGHLAALNYLAANDNPLIVNLGTGRPYSVLEMVNAFGKACGKDIPYQFSPRRAGDLAEYYADPTLATSLLGWTAKHGIEEMCMDTWRWQSDNPDGY